MYLAKSIINTQRGLETLLHVYRCISFVTVSSPDLLYKLYWNETNAILVHNLALLFTPEEDMNHFVWNDSNPLQEKISCHIL